MCAVSDILDFMETGITQKNDGFYTHCNELSFRITGLKNYDFSRLSVTLKVYRQHKQEFHIDTLDLYSQRHRDRLIDAICTRLYVDKKTASEDVDKLINRLETHRVSLADKGSQNAPVELSDEDRQQAIDYLKDENLLVHISDDLHDIGVVGEEVNKLISYIATVSRLQEDPLGVLILSRSGAGKTHLQNSICKLVPDEHRIQYTRLTGQSLFYRSKDDLKNKVLSIEEDEGMGDALYSIRTLQSNQRISIATTRSNAQTGKLAVDEYTVEGPVSIFISTTNPDALDPETRSRFLILTVDESIEHTKRIHDIKLRQNTLSGFHRGSSSQRIIKRHNDIHRVLKPLVPLFPDEIKISFPIKQLQMRREFGKFISLVKAITLLHQYQRITGKLNDGTEYVLIDKKDIELAIELGKDIFHRSVDDVAPPSRKLLNEIMELVKDKDTDASFTRRDIRNKIHWSEAQIRRYITPLVKMGYIKPTTGKQGSRYSYELIEEALECAEYFSENAISFR